MEKWDIDLAFILNAAAIEARPIYVCIVKLDIYERLVYLRDFISASHAVRIESLSHPSYVISTLDQSLIDPWRPAFRPLCLLRHRRTAAKEIDTRPLSSIFLALSKFGKHILWY